MQYVPSRWSALLALLTAAPAVGLAQQAERVPLHGSSLTAPPRIAEALDPYRANPDSADVARLLTHEARFTGFPASSADELLVARLWGRAGVADAAMKTLEAIPTAKTGSLALLERARVLLETDTDRDAGTRAYWAACETRDPDAIPDFRGDLLAISTPEERATWTEGSPAEFAGCGWLREFWGERAHRMAISVDERVALHYRRLAHARDWYWIARPRYAESWADRRGRAEGLTFDDRGLMYVRMGPPETDEGFIGLGGEGVDVAFQVADLSGEATSFLTGVPDVDLGAVRCWPYPRPDGYRIFCFAQMSVGGLSRADGDYKLLQSIPGTVGTHFYHRYVLNSNMPRTWFRSNLRAAVVGLGGAASAWQADLDRVEVRHYGHVGEVRTRDNISEALEQVPDVPAVRSTARLMVETLRFLNPGQRAWQVWTLASVRAGDLRPEPDENGVPTLVAGGRFSILDGTNVEIHELPRRHIPEASVRDDDGILFASVFTAPPGRLPLTVVIEDGNRTTAGNYLLDTLNVPAIGGLPMVSDIAVARETGGSWTRDGMNFLNVVPSHVTNGDGSIYTYFEVYQVRPGTRYQVEIRMAPVELTDEILRLDPDELDFRLQFTAQMSGDIGRHPLRLDLGDAPPGEYSLAVRVQDVVTGAYSLPSITDVFIPREGDGR